MIKEFKNPSNQFRPIPFWSWNDKLDTEELKYQISEMKKAGMGGYFMHARSGLKTQYLSEEWFDCIQAGLDGAKQEDMNAWIYDEEGWPSGFAGGIVPGMTEDFHAKFMTMERHQSMDTIEVNEMISIYCLHKETGFYEKIKKNEKYFCKEGEELLAFRKHRNPYYVDTLNKAAIQAFLKVTHEVYFERFGEDFGKHLHGFFTDEPRLTCNHFGDLAWSDELPEDFKAHYGYDITEHLPALYLKTPSYEKYRYDFWETVSRMFTENYMKTIYDWCEDHQCKATGHIMMEESIFSQMTSTAGVMPFYEYMHIPGIDWLRRMISSPVIGKQVGSVACQLGKKQVLTESFALCGWDVSFEELKWIAEWQFVNGVNQICQHLMAYTLKGVRKRDYPPSHFTQQTWWKEARLFNDYLSRLCVALSEGDQTADVLLIHPMRSGYIAFDGTRTEEIRILDEEFTKAAENLSDKHISYHFGDETIIKKYGSIKEGKLRVGKIAYQTVILPHMYAMDKKTLELLLAFAAQGGKILSLGKLPSYTNGEAAALEELKEKVKPVLPEEVRAVMEAEGLVSVSVAEQGSEVTSIHYLQRETEAGILFFFVNLSQEKTAKPQIKLLGKKGQLLQFEAESGEVRKIPFTYQGKNTVTELAFEPMQSYILLWEEGDFKERAENKQERQLIELSDSFCIEKMGPNSLTLDTCSYRIDGGAWEEKIPVIRLQNKLLDLQRPCEIELLFDFDIQMDLSQNQEFYAVIEEAFQYEIEVNGKRVFAGEEGWWKDKTFRKVSIKEQLQEGKNTILLKTAFRQPQKVYDVLYGKNVYETELNKITYDIELESIYLLGDFGVISKSGFKQRERNAIVTEGPFEIVAAPKKLKGPDFTTEGLLFFAEDIELTQKIRIEKEEGKRIILKLGKQRAPLVKVSVNGQHVKDSLWAPYEADITDFAAEGENEIRLHVFSSNRNLLGPHHHINGECYNVGPESYTGKWSWVERESEADATDIESRTKNYWTDSYCFVTFGI